MNFIAAAVTIIGGVQGLMDVADEMYHELECFEPLAGGYRPPPAW